MNPLEISFTPVDNQRLANLCGALDENLMQIESAFDVSIARRGEHFSISGQPDPARLAADALQRFYQLASHNVSLQESVFYTDSISDLPMLDAVGEPRIVNPDPRLKRLAKQRGWSIERWV